MCAAVQNGVWGMKSYPVLHTPFWRVAFASFSTEFRKLVKLCRRRNWTFAAARGSEEMQYHTQEISEGSIQEIDRRLRKIVPLDRQGNEYDFASHGEWWQHLADACEERRVDPIATLAAALAHVSAASPPWVQLSAPVGSRQQTGIYVAIAGSSGFGKSSAFDLGRQLIQFPHYNRCRIEDSASDAGAYRPYVYRASSGEGIEDLFNSLHRNDKAPLPAAVLEWDELDTLNKTQRRPESTLNSTLKSAYAGAELGGHAAERTKQRKAAAGSYSLSLLAAGTYSAVGELLANAENGTATRWATFPGSSSSGEISFDHIDKDVPTGNAHPIWALEKWPPTNMKNDGVAEIQFCESLVHAVRRQHEMTSAGWFPPFDEDQLSEEEFDDALKSLQGDDRDAYDHYRQWKQIDHGPQTSRMLLKFAAAFAQLRGVTWSDTDMPTTAVEQVTEEDAEAAYAMLSISAQTRRIITSGMKDEMAKRYHQQKEKDRREKVKDQDALDANAAKKRAGMLAAAAEAVYRWLSDSAKFGQAGLTDRDISQNTRSVPVKNYADMFGCSLSDATQMALDLLSDPGGCETADGEILRIDTYLKPLKNGKVKRYTTGVLNSLPIVVNFDDFADEKSVS